MQNSNNIKFLAALGLMPFAVIIHGYVLSQLWKLFIVPVFSLPLITAIEAAGIIFVIGFIFMKIDWENKMDEISTQEFISKWISHSLITPFIMLGFGYIISMFM